MNYFRTTLGQDRPVGLTLPSIENTFVRKLTSLKILLKKRRENHIFEFIYVSSYVIKF